MFPLHNRPCRNIQNIDVVFFFFRLKQPEDMFSVASCWHQYRNHDESFNQRRPYTYALVRVRQSILPQHHLPINAHPNVSVQCCPESAVIAPANQPSFGRSPLVSDTCSGDGSFTITASAAPNLDGCYKDTFETLQEGSFVYSRSGGATEPEVGVFSLTTDDGDVSREAPSIGHRKRIFKL